MRVKHEESPSRRFGNMGGTADYVRPLHKICKGLFARKMKPCNPAQSWLQGACSQAAKFVQDYRAKPATEKEQSEFEVARLQESRQLVTKLAAGSLLTGSQVCAGL